MTEKSKSSLSNKIWNRKTFIKFLGACIGAPLISGWYMRYFETRNFEVTEKKIDHCLRGKIPSGIKILHMSDFHASVEVPLSLIEESIFKAKELEPDLILLTGDFITWKIDDPDKYRDLLSILSETAPVFTCLGNHDGGRWAKGSAGYQSIEPIKSFLESCNFNVLVNQQAMVSIKGKEFDIVGLGDLWAKQSKPEGLLPDIKNGRPLEIERPIILLAHNPDTKMILMNYDWDLMLSGHTHGGQLVIPLINARPFIPVYDKSHPEGLKVWETYRWIHITRGIGNRHGLRFNCRPEISLLIT